MAHKSVILDAFLESQLWFVSPVFVLAEGELLSVEFWNFEEPQERVGESNYSKKGYHVS